jgi:hypothetical protein
MVERGMNLRVMPIPNPKPKAMDAMRRKAVEMRSENFILAANEFLEREHWFDSKGYVLDRTPWETFLGSPETYLKFALERKARKVKQDAEERIRVARQAEENRARVRKERWDKYLKARTLDWPTMTFEEREFIAGIQGEPETVQDVSDADFTRADELETRFWQWTRTTQKYGMLGWLNRVGAMVLSGTLKPSRRFVDTHERIRKAVEGSPWDASMRKFHEEFKAAYTQLDDELNDAADDGIETEWGGTQEDIDNGNF